MNYVYEVSDSKGKIIIPVEEALDTPEKALARLNSLFGDNAPIYENIVEPLTLRKYSTFEWDDDNGEPCWAINGLVSTQGLISIR